VIDHPTWERAQPAAAGFEKRPDVAIRGRRKTQDVYLLAMPTSSLAGKDQRIARIAYAHKLVAVIPALISRKRKR
jgi:hypothetical protein